MERARVAAAVVSAVLVAARLGLRRRRSKSPSLPEAGLAPAAEPLSHVVTESPPSRSRPTGAAPVVGRAGMPRVVGGLDHWLGVAGVAGLLVTLGLVVRNASGWPVARPEGAETDWALVSALMTLAVWAVFLVWKVPEWQAASRVGSSGVGPAELFEIENAARGTLGQILSGLAVLAGLLFAWQQLGNTSETLEVGQEGQITERFTRAVDQLGSDGVAIRLGGIYALERIGRDSARDRGPVLEVLAAFVRQNAPIRGLAAAPDGTPAAASGRLSVDVQAVLTLLTRPGSARRDGGCLDLGQTRLVGADLAGGDLTALCFDGADLSRADLSGSSGDARLGGVNLGSADLGEARLEGAVLIGADLTGANLSRTNLTGADLTDADLGTFALDRTNLRNARLNGADFEGAFFSEADLTGAIGVTQAQLDSAVVDERTRLPGVVRGTPER